MLLQWTPFKIERDQITFCPETGAELYHCTDLRIAITTSSKSFVHKKYAEILF